MTDPFNLERFVKAQDPVFGDVIAELRAGEKIGHWMWFVFPQMRGLGRSAMARTYAISSGAEAEAYLSHPVLDPRLKECTQLMLEVVGRSIDEILGSPDNLKFGSSMTLFAHATTDNRLFLDALEKYCGGQFDARTLELL
ncbi:MAG: DUF1810 domain-containing protein [Steroidobacteraceae bacterium]